MAVRSEDFWEVPRTRLARQVTTVIHPQTDKNLGMKRLVQFYMFDEVEKEPPRGRENKPRASPRKNLIPSDLRGKKTPRNSRQRARF